MVAATLPYLPTLADFLDPWLMPPADAHGFREHPQCAQADDPVQALRAIGCETQLVHPAHADDTPATFATASAWEPHWPAGAGWRLAGVYPTDTRPAALFARLPLARHRAGASA